MRKFLWSVRNDQVKITEVQVVKRHHLFVSDLDYYEVLSPKSIRDTSRFIWSHSLNDTLESANASLTEALTFTFASLQKKGGPSKSSEEIQEMIESAKLERLP